MNGQVEGNQKWEPGRRDERPGFTWGERKSECVGEEERMNEKERAPIGKQVGHRARCSRL